MTRYGTVSSRLRSPVSGNGSKSKLQAATMILKLADLGLTKSSFALAADGRPSSCLTLKIVL